LSPSDATQQQEKPSRSGQCEEVQQYRALLAVCRSWESKGEAATLPLGRPPLERGEALDAALAAFAGV
jgi:hypothetical protein